MSNCSQGEFATEAVRELKTETTTAGQAGKPDLRELPGADADDFAHGVGVDSALREGERAERPGFAAGAEVVDGDEGGW